MEKTLGVTASSQYSHEETQAAAKATAVQDTQPESEAPSAALILKQLRLGPPGIEGAQKTATAILKNRTRRELIEDLEATKDPLGLSLADKLKPLLAGEQASGVAHVAARAFNAIRSHVPLIGNTPELRAKSVNEILSAHGLDLAKEDQDRLFKLAREELAQREASARREIGKTEEQQTGPSGAISKLSDSLSATSKQVAEIRKQLGYRPGEVKAEETLAEHEERVLKRFVTPQAHPELFGASKEELAAQNKKIAAEEQARKEAAERYYNQPNPFESEKK